MMFKRIATFLFGIALVSLGILFFIAPERAFVLQVLMRWWPVFLVLAGIVRVAGHLLDKRPRSPLGGMLLTALGGTLLAANLRGQTGVFEIIGDYWFWILLALIAGRVIRQYSHRPGDGARPRAFGPGTLAFMLVITGVGLAAYWLNGNHQNLARVRLPFRLTNVRAIFNSDYSIADQTPLRFSLGRNARLHFDGFDGDIEIRRTNVPEASATAVKRIRAASEEEAKAVAAGIRLEVKAEGDGRIFSISTDDAKVDFVVQLQIELPTGTKAGIDANGLTGQITLSDLEGEHSLHDVERVRIAGNRGGVSVDGSKVVHLERINGRVHLSKASQEVSLRDVTGPVVIDLAGGAATLERIEGSIQIAARNARIELRDIAQNEATPPATVEMKDIQDSRIDITRVRGAIGINSSRTRIDANEISGETTIISSFERVRVRNVNGALKVTANDGSVEAANLQGPAEIEATREISAKNFHSSLTVSSRIGEITLALDHTPGGDLRATSEHGAVRLTIPENSRFRLDASTAFGRLKLRGFDDLNLPRRQRTTTITYAPDPAAPLLTLRSTNGDIFISSSGVALASREQRGSN